MEAESGRWTGPFPSPYGLHLVWVDEVWRSQVSPGGNVSGSPWTSGVLARERQERAELRTALDVLRRNVNVVRTGGGSS